MPKKLSSKEILEDSIFNSFSARLNKNPISTQKTFLPSRQSGQAVLEYVLLLSLSVVFAAFLLNAFVSRNEDEPGVLVKKWREMQTAVGQDLPDKCSPRGGGAAQCSNPP